MRTISLRQFRDSVATIDEPVAVVLREADGNLRALGDWTPAQIALEDAQVVAAIANSPTSRSAPVIPSGSLVVGTAETDRAQSGTPDDDPSRGSAKAGASPAPHEPGGVMHTAPLGSSLSPDVASWTEGGAVPLDEFLRNARSLGDAASLEPQRIIPPKPAGYVHDPSFNSKGSRPAPKTGGRK